MIQKIIDEVAKAYSDYKGLDEIKRGIMLAMAVTGLEYTVDHYYEIFDGVMYKLADREEC